MDGGIQLALLLSTTVAIVPAMAIYHAKWKDIEEGIESNIKSLAMIFLILLLIGSISGSWMISGVVPTLIYYGLRILTPKIFLLAACVISALVSLLIGSSWTTIATIGIALEGIASALGFPMALTAGAIISGAYFGDKMSPLSDTTVIASGLSQVPLFTHIRYLRITTLPAFIITCIILLIIGLSFKEGSDIDVSSYIRGLETTFNISAWLLLVPIATGVFVALRLPAIVVLFFSSLIAGATALIAQPELLREIGGNNGIGGIIEGLMITFYGPTSVETGNASLNELVRTNGMRGMLSVIFLILCSSSFNGALSGCGYIRSLTDTLSRGIKRRSTLVASTVGTGILSNMATGDQYLAIILTSNIYKKIYEEKGYEPRLLSRTTEDSATTTSVLVPWNTCGMTQSMVLRVATVDYLPYCFFNLLSPIFSIIVAIIGYKIKEKETGRAASADREETKEKEG